MAVVSADRLSGRSGNASADVREHIEIWEVITDAANDTQEEILASGMIPGGFSAFPADPAARASRYQFDQDDDTPTYWRVTITYSTRQPAPGVDSSGNQSGSPEQNYTENPLLKPADVSMRTQTVQMAIQRDLDGKLICDSTGRPFVTQTIDDNGIILSISKNRAAVSMLTLRNYRNAVSSDNFFGIPAGHLKMLSLRADVHWDKNVFYWTLAAEMFVADDDWIARYGQLDNLSLLDRGPEYIVGGVFDANLGYRTGGTRKRFMSNGQLIEANLSGQGTPSASETYRSFRVKPRQPFAALGVYP